MADQAWSDLRAQTRAAADPAVQARLEQVGWKIVEASGRTDLAWEFVVFEDQAQAPQAVVRWLSLPAF